MQHLRNLDHIVVATPDLDATVQAFTDATGVSPVLGGVHPDQGTRNYLVAFTGGGYLEIIGIDEPRSGPRVFDLHLVDAPTVATFAVHPDAPEAKLGAAYELGFDLGVLRAGQRRDPSGTLLRWRLTPPLASDHSGVQPFVIDWSATPSPEHTVDARVTLDDFHVTPPEPARVQELYAALDVDVPVEEGPEPVLTVTVHGPSGQWTLR